VAGFFVGFEIICIFVAKTYCNMMNSSIDHLRSSNGKTFGEIKKDTRAAIENRYMECWAEGVSVPFWDNQGNFYMANPDGSEDLIDYNDKNRSYQVISRTAAPGKGRFAYLLNR
jgi:hypothetical protein